MAPSQTSTRCMKSKSGYIIKHIKSWALSSFSHYQDTIVSNCTENCHADLCDKNWDLMSYRSIDFEMRLSTVFEWLSRPQGERCGTSCMSNITLCHTHVYINTDIHFFFGFSDLTFTLCTWMNRTRQDIVTGQQAARSANG